jgi:hypothetical protein
MDMTIPPGMSGSPVFRPRPLEVVGVAYREHDTQLTGEVRVITFAYAHHLLTLREGSCAATQGRPLAEYLVR